MMGHQFRRVVALTCVAGACTGVAACSPGTSSKPAASTPPTGKVVTDLSKLGKLTITEWDKQAGEPSQNKAQNELNAMFHAKYPNVTIHRVSRSFNDLKTTLKLALSGGSPPDVVQVNQGPGDLGAIAKAGLLRPLDGYAAAYHWTDLFQPTLLEQNRATSAGAWGSGRLYGISNTSELVGVFYDKALLAKARVKAPTTYADFAAALPKIKAAGILPIQYGASDKAPAIHVFGPVLTNLAGATKANGLVFGKAGSSWQDPVVTRALGVLADWGSKGYISADANGQSGDQAAASFAGGKGAFMITGTWQVANLEEKMKSNVGFLELKPNASATPTTIGGLGLLFAVTAKSKHADAAAAYVNFLTSPEAQDVIARSGDLPSAKPASFTPQAKSLQADVYTALHSILSTGGLVPYLDYSTPDFYNVLTAQVQQVTSGRTSPAQAAKALQSEAASFRTSQ
jgi:raffinose/stachyose/melibiose transport system substrate-binding protein